MTAVRLQRTVPASARRVFRAWLDPELLQRWVAPVAFEVGRVEVDARVGGHYRAWHVDASGEDVGGFEAEILELVPDERLVLRWDFVGPDRRPLADGSSRLAVTLRPVGEDACEVTLVHDRLDGAERAMPGITDGTREGWTGTLGRMERAVCGGELLGVARFTLHPGRAADFKRLSRRCMEVVRTQDTGTLQYDIFLDADERAAVVIERYRDAAALREHLANIGPELMAEILETGAVEGETLGEPDAQLREDLADSPVRLLLPWQSLTA